MISNRPCSTIFGLYNSIVSPLQSAWNWRGSLSGSYDGRIEGNWRDSLAGSPRSKYGNAFCHFMDLVMNLKLKSIRIHLDLLISTITCSILDQFQNFKYQQLANYLRFMMMLFIRTHSLPVRS